MDSARSQDLVLSTDAIPGGTIKKWEWHCESCAGGTYNNFSIKLCHTGVNKLVANFATNFGGKTPLEVFGRSSYYLSATPGAWFGFAFDKEFEYNGKDNLVVDVSWSGDSGGTCYTYWSPATARCVYNYNGSAVYLANYVHYMRITLDPNAVAPMSLGRLRAIFK